MDRSRGWLSCKFILVFCVELVLSQSCDVVLDVQVPFGQIFVEDGLRTCLRCAINGMTSPQTTWLVRSTDSNRRLEALDPTHGQVVNGVLVLYNSSSLILPGFSNAVETQCSAFSLSYTAFLVSTVFVPPTVTDVTIIEGETLEICCTDDNPSGRGVTQKWQRLDGTLMTADAVFTLENANRSHAGIYQCVLTNALNETLVANATVSVQYLGDVTSPDPPIQDVSLGESSVTLSCNYRGVPVPDVQWYHNDTLLLDLVNDNIQVDTRDEVSRLQLSGIQRDSGGVYTCNASNVVDWKNISVALRIIVPPAPASNLTLVIYGETSVILSWMNNFDGHSPITGAEIEIFSNNTLQETRVFPGNNVQSAEITGLDPLRNFTFVLRVLNTVGRSDPTSIDGTISSSIVPPAPVTNLIVTNIAESTISLSWQNGFNGNSRITGVEIKLYIDQQHVDTQSFLGGPSQESAQLSALEPLTDYTFVIFVLNILHRSDPESIEASTLSLRLSAPTITNVLMLSSTSIQLEWEIPLYDPETTDAPNSWKIEYAYQVGQPQSLIISDPNTTSHTFMNLLKGTQYQIRVAGMNIRGLGMYSEYRNVATVPEPPSGSPTSFNATTTSRTIMFSWSPPSLTDQNGVILSYTLSCTLQANNNEETIRMVYLLAGSHVLGGFRPFSTYNCSLLATNSAGDGPSISRLFNTKDDHQLFQLRLTGVKCADWVITDATRKVNLLADIIIDAVQERCRCDFPKDRITDGALHCSSDSTHTVTYLAVLHGTAELTALGLLDFVKDWSNSVPDIRIDSIVLQVDRTCDMSTSLNGCGPDDGGDLSISKEMLALILGVIGGVLVVLLVLGLLMIIGVLIHHISAKRNDKADNPGDAALPYIRHLYPELNDPENTRGRYTAVSDGVIHYDEPVLPGPEIERAQQRISQAVSTERTDTVQTSHEDTTMSRELPTNHTYEELDQFQSSAHPPGTPLINQVGDSDNTDGPSVPTYHDQNSDCQTSSADRGTPSTHQVADSANTGSANPDTESPTHQVAEVGNTDVPSMLNNPSSADPGTLPTHRISDSANTGDTSDANPGTSPCSTHYQVADSANTVSANPDTESPTHQVAELENTNGPSLLNNRQNGDCHTKSIEQIELTDIPVARDKRRRSQKTRVENSYVPSPIKKKFNPNCTHTDV